MFLGSGAARDGDEHGGGAGQNRTVLVKRRRRKGQRKEEGLRLKRIDDHFRSEAGTQLKKKRKSNDREPENRKKGKFGQ